MGIAELMRVLVDEEQVPWKAAWEVTTKVYAYTNHTVLPEALEKWSVGMVGYLLPRHLQIIYKINHHFLLEVEEFWQGRNVDIHYIKRKLSLIEEDHDKKIRMAHLAIVGSHHVNGVAHIHSELLKTNLFPDFYQIFPSRFTNVTNGVTPRRWIKQANKELGLLLNETLGEDWIKDTTLLAGLRSHAKDREFQKKWRTVKHKNKKRLAAYVRKELGISIPVAALFDVHIKRLHEYKRQFLNILSVIWRWKQISGMTLDERADVLPRVVIFAGKAAPGYYVAKLIIKLISIVAEKINNDPDMEGLLSVIFFPNYNVSLAELLIPASNLSQHISTAGMEASGTSNMKFAMNGCLILGTMDGANIEIREEIGHKNMFIFGLLAHEVDEKRRAMYRGEIAMPNSLKQVLDLIEEGTFGEFPECKQLLDTIRHNNDYYLLSVDWESYLEAQNQVDKAYKDSHKWTRMSILSTAGTSKFSSDRSVQEYAERIWNVQPYPRPGPVVIDTRQLAGHVSQVDQYSPLETLTSPLVALERLSEKDAKTMYSFSPSPGFQRSSIGMW
eukprot:TRINITY_DN11636_c0_g2_i3.p1 TRINITY_DN11636_c0_g2~~TRINITY_DN11636_c0_g2_i3.p1  ORF type:complete len:634 (-),score=138.90 TRINITY_DN11636_c0_g2_i3:71-1738(-)